MNGLKFKIYLFFTNHKAKSFCKKQLENGQFHSSNWSAIPNSYLIKLFGSLLGQRSSQKKTSHVPASFCAIFGVRVLYCKVVPMIFGRLCSHQTQKFCCKKISRNQLIPILATADSCQQLTSGGTSRKQFWEIGHKVHFVAVIGLSESGDSILMQ